ncbi:MAG TPA: hypothetical protein VGH48_17055 [Caldimonas sp.]|jgi:hypothetical protein
MTNDNLFSAVVTFSLMAGATIAFGADLVQSSPAPTAKQMATLPTVTVVGKRIAATDRITLPTVTVTGRRAALTEVAANTRTVEQQTECAEGG